MADRRRMLGALLVPAAILLALLAPAAAAAGAAGAATLVTNPTALVNPFIGTGANSDFTAGNTFPGADVPHGMVQWSPDTTERPSGGGYDYADSAITGFSLTHVDGTGCAAAAGIAAAAGVGRITLYGHFSTRAELVDAVLARTIEHADAILDGTDPGGDPADALARLVAASWQIVYQFSNILVAAHRELPAERIRGVHDPILRRVQSLIATGQRAGTFRTDLPADWLATTAFSLMHTAAEEAAAGRIAPGGGARLITATLLAAFTPPVDRHHV